MASYTAYYDASGKEEQRDSPIAIGAVVSTEIRWLKLATEWDAVLRAFEVPYLHMKNFNSQSSKSPYKALRDNKARREAFFRRLLNVVKHRTHKTFLGHLIPSDFHAIAKRYDLSAVGSPYCLVMGSTIGRVEQWMRKRHPNARLLHVVEQGDTSQALFSSLIRLEGITPIFQPKRDQRTGKWFVPFQPCDWLAWEHGLEVKRRRGIRTQPVRESLREIARLLSYEIGGFRQEDIVSMCEAHASTFPKLS